MTLLLWLYATRKRHLVDADLDQDVITFFTIRFLLAPVIFLLSIPLAFVTIFQPTFSGPKLATYFWILLAVALVAHINIYRRWLKTRPQGFMGDTHETASRPLAGKREGDELVKPEQETKQKEMPARSNE